MSLAGAPANGRAGPGPQYPVKYAFARRHVPLEVIAETPLWRKVRDHQGDVMWLHASLLSGRRTVVIRGPQAGAPLFKRPHAEAAPVAAMENGVVAFVTSCEGAWCRLQVQSHKGWAQKAHLWGVYAEETVD